MEVDVTGETYSNHGKDEKYMWKFAWKPERRRSF